jgi:hypothetical protein
MNKTVSASRSRQVLYHSTSVPPVKVLQEGLVQHLGQGHSEESVWVFQAGWLPSGVIFLSARPGKYEGKYVYAVDVEGLKLLADYPSLVDKGAYVDPDEGILYWERRGDVPRAIRPMVDEENSISKEDLSGTDTLIVTGTAAVEGPIPPSRVVVYKHK